jgi:alpha-beta hydrolase superfamily lysophospholipase
MRRLPVAATAAALLVALALPAGPIGAGAAAGAAPATFVDQPVHYTVDGLTVYATWRHPVHPHGSYPAALLIAGSGPTDRNGNTPEITGSVNTLATVADWLSADGVASLRYDKLGSGRTGLGAYALNPGAIGLTPFEDEAAAGLRFVAAQPGVDRRRLALVGHSEGALFALLVATGHSGRVPAVHALVLLEPLSRRYLDVISEQVDAQISAQQEQGVISAATARAAGGALAAAVHSLRTTGTVPADLPYGLSNVLSPASARFLAQADRYDPATLGATLPRGTPVLVSCSDADVQVSCADVAHLVGGLRQGHAALDQVHLHDVDHVLKVDPSGSPADYGKPLAFSPQLQAALAGFVARHLR